jgi:hypothetical protein
MERVGARRLLHAQEFVQPRRLGPFVVVQHGDERGRRMREGMLDQRVASLRDSALGNNDRFQRPAVTAAANTRADLGALAALGVVVGDQHRNARIRLEHFQRIEQALETLRPAIGRDCHDHVRHGRVSSGATA